VDAGQQRRHLFLAPVEDLRRRPVHQTKIETGNFNEDKQNDLTAEDVRFTVKGSTLYAFVMGWPEKEAVVRRFGLASPQNPGKIRKVETARAQGRSQVEAGAIPQLRVEMPAEKISDVGITLKVELA
jgi:alpha-L-fucosidase